MLALLEVQARGLQDVLEDEALRHMAVVVLTGRDEQAEILSMYRLRCNSYVCKPRDFDKYMDMMKRLADYWFSLVALPTRNGGMRAPRRLSYFRASCLCRA